MLSEVQNRWVGRHREAVIVLLLTVLAFAVRAYRVDFNSLSEDCLLYTSDAADE